MPNYTAYNPFAEAYDRYWGMDGARGILPVLNKLLLKNLAPGSKILDLCCGTGQLARILTDHGFAVTGVDSSSNMLLHARTNAPHAKFILGDVRTFRPNIPYDAVVSTSNSLSHITKMTELRMTFQNVYQALKENSWFLFDVHMDAGYKAHWQGEFQFTDDDMLCSAKSSYAAASHIASLKISTRTLQHGVWQQTATVIRQKAYTEEQLKSGLEAAGFISVAVRDARRGQAPKGPLQRALLMGLKPSPNNQSA